MPKPTMPQEGSHNAWAPLGQGQNGYLSIPNLAEISQWRFTSTDLERLALKS